MKTYKANPFVNTPLLLIPLLLAIPLIENGITSNSEIIGFIILIALALLIFLTPFGLRLNVCVNYMQTTLFGITLSTIGSPKIQSIEYRNLFKRGLGVGKGLIINMKNGKTYTVSKKLYGKTTINHVKEILSQQIL